MVPGHESVNIKIAVYTHSDRSSGEGNADTLAAMLAAHDD
jgi:hypothetical protein